MSINEKYEESQLVTSDISERVGSVGYTYILFRKTNNNIIKVGYTSVSSQNRAENYTDGDWQVHKEYPMPVWLAKLTEKAAHANLKSYWLDPKVTGGTASEIFTCSLPIAEQAVELAFSDQLRQVLRSLKVSPEVEEYILYENSVIESSQLTKLIEKEKEDADKIKNLVSNLNLLNNEIKIAKDEINQLKNKLSLIVLDDSNELLEQINTLERFSDQKISPSQFEKLRDNFRIAIEIIRIMRLRESHNSNQKNKKVV